MAVIKSGASTDELTIGPTSKAARVTIHDDAGNSLQPSPLSIGTYNILVRQTGTTAAGANVFAIWNSNGTRTIVVRRVVMQLSFDGTGAATLMRYEIGKGTGVTAFSAGAVVTAALHRTSFGAPASAVARVLDTGLTMTGLTFTPYRTINGARMTPSATVNATGVAVVYDFDEIGIPIELANQEALVIRNGPTNASVVGDTLFGSATILER